MEPEHRPEGPPLKHFRQESVASALVAVRVRWLRCIKHGVQLPVDHTNEDEPQQVCSQLSPHGEVIADEESQTNGTSGSNSADGDGGGCDTDNSEGRGNEDHTESEDSESEVSDSDEEEAGIDEEQGLSEASSEPPPKRACAAKRPNVQVQEADDEPVVDTASMTESLKTKHAKWAAYVLGPTDSVRVFDAEKAKASTTTNQALQVASRRLYLQLVNEVKALQKKIAEGDSTTRTDNRRRVAERLLAKW